MVMWLWGVRVEGETFLKLNDDCNDDCPRRLLLIIRMNLRIKGLRRGGERYVRDELKGGRGRRGRKVMMV